MLAKFGPEFISPVCEEQFYFDGLVFDVIRYAEDSWLPSHYHEDKVFLDFCLEGIFQEFWEKRPLVRETATLNYLPTGVVHGNHFPKRTRTFQVALTGRWRERIERGAGLGNTPRLYESGLPVWIAARMYREFLRRDSVSSLALEGMLLELMAEMSRQSTDSVETGCPRWLQQVKDYLHAHFKESLSVEAIAATVGVHPAHLMRSFRQQYRCTIGEYVRKLRVDHSCRLLSAGDSSAAEIAYTIGFSDQSHFNRTFKEFTGMTPIEFQRAIGKQTKQKE